MLPPPPPQGRKGFPLVFDSCPKLHRPSLAARRRQLLLIQGAGHRRKSIQDKNQLLPECAAAIDTRARRVAPCSSRGSSSNSDGGVGEESETQTPQANVCYPGLKLRVPEWIARQFQNLTRCGQTLVMLTCSLKVSAWGLPGRAPAWLQIGLKPPPSDPGSAAFKGRGRPHWGCSYVSVNSLLLGLKPC